MGQRLWGGKRAVVSTQRSRLATDISEQHPDIKMRANVSCVAVKARDESAKIPHGWDVDGPHLSTCAQVQAGVEMDVKCALNHLGGRREYRSNAERKNM